jgi:hypothetical protein
VNSFVLGCERGESIQLWFVGRARLRPNCENQKAKAELAVRTSSAFAKSFGVTSGDQPASLETGVSLTSLSTPESKGLLSLHSAYRTVLEILSYYKSRFLALDTSPDLFVIQTVGR